MKLNIKKLKGKRTTLLLLIAGSGVALYFLFTPFRHFVLNEIVYRIEALFSGKPVRRIIK